MERNELDALLDTALHCTAGDKISGAELRQAMAHLANYVESRSDTGIIPASRLPSYVDDVLEYATFSALPLTGETGKIYVTTTGVDANKQWRWAGSLYIELVSSPGSTDGIAEGTTNLYFTNARAQAANAAALATKANIASPTFAGTATFSVVVANEIRTADDAGKAFVLGRKSAQDPRALLQPSATASGLVLLSPNGNPALGFGNNFRSIYKTDGSGLAVFSDNGMILDGVLQVAALRVTAGAGIGKVLTSDGAGSATWQNIPGGSSSAATVAYTPNVGNFWRSSVTTVEGALSELAMRVNALTRGRIAVTGESTVEAVGDTLFTIDASTAGDMVLTVNYTDATGAGAPFLIFKRVDSSTANVSIGGAVSAAIAPGQTLWYTLNENNDFVLFMDSSATSTSSSGYTEIPLSDAAEIDLSSCAADGCALVEISYKDAAYPAAGTTTVFVTELSGSPEVEALSDDLSSRLNKIEVSGNGPNTIIVHPVLASGDAASGKLRFTIL